MEPALISGSVGLSRWESLSTTWLLANPLQVSSQQKLVLIYRNLKDGKLSYLKHKRRSHRYANIGRARIKLGTLWSESRDLTSAPTMLSQNWKLKLKLHLCTVKPNFNCWFLRVISTCIDESALYYSQTWCSFDDNLANSQRNIGTLIESLSGASCTLHEQVAQFTCS